MYSGLVYLKLITRSSQSKVYAWYVAGAELTTLGATVVKLQSVFIAYVSGCRC